MPAARKIQCGDVVLVRARVVGVHEALGLVGVRIVETGGRYGGPGYRADVVSIEAVAMLDPAPPEDPALVPPAR